MFAGRKFKAALAIDEKSNEFTAITALLNLLYLKDAG